MNKAGYSAGVAEASRLRRVTHADVTSRHFTTTVAAVKAMVRHFTTTVAVVKAMVPVLFCASRRSFASSRFPS